MNFFIIGHEKLHNLQPLFVINYENKTMKRFLSTYEYICVAATFMIKYIFLKILLRQCIREGKKLLF